MHSNYAQTWSGSRELLAEIRAPWWLKTPYGATLLSADFGGEPPVRLNFDVKLPSDSSLASPANSRLREEIYDFLCLQAHPLARGRRNRSADKDREHLLAAVHVIDYFLLHAQQIGLVDYGFAAVGTQNIQQFLLDVSSARTSAEGIYGWTKRLGSYLREQAVNTPPELVAQTLKKHAALATIDAPPREWQLGLKVSEVLASRVFLFLNGHYRDLDKNSGPYRFGPNSRTLSRQVYANTLLGSSGLMSSFERHVELCWGSRAMTGLEKPRVEVWSARQDRRCSKQRLSAYGEKLLNWRHLSRHGIGIREEVLEDFEMRSVTSVVPLKDIDGVKFVPPQVIAQALRDAICFFYEHAEHILTSLASVLKHTRERGLKPFQLLGGTLEELLHADTRVFGVRAWSTADYLERYFDRPPTQDDFNDFFRVNHAGLLECVRVLYGACQVIVGTLQAARQGEILDLTVGSLDPSLEWLALLTRKSGFDGHRNEDYRPVPAVAVDVVMRLAAFIKEMGLDDGSIFVQPNYWGALGANRSSSAQALDLFCDYIQTATDDTGARYYLREHQLRKFFAMTFFHCCGFAGLDTLRWFLRQLDMKQLWAYLKASVPGASLRHYMSTAVVMTIRNGSDELVALKAVLLQRFGVSSFEVLGDMEMAEALDDLQADKAIEVKPIFGMLRGEPYVKLAVLVDTEGALHAKSTRHS